MRRLLGGMAFVRHVGEYGKVASMQRQDTTPPGIGPVRERPTAPPGRAVERARPRGKVIALVGAGFTGTALALHLLPRLPGGTTLLLIDPRAPGNGVAYGTRAPWHL